MRIYYIYELNIAVYLFNALGLCSVDCWSCLEGEVRVVSVGEVFKDSIGMDSKSTWKAASLMGIVTCFVTVDIITRSLICMDCFDCYIPRRRTFLRTAK
jgi:hypothetical protein